MIRVLAFFAASLIAQSAAFAAPALRDPTLRVEEVVSGLSLPTTMAFIGPGDILVLQKNDGKVRRVTGGILQPGAVLDVAVDNASERGLLGIALHPNFPATPFVYLYFTESSTAGDSSGSPAGNRIYRYTWNGDTLGSPSLILDLPATPGPNHDGGVIAFGPDGKLYAVIGDLNRNGQLQNFTSGDPDDTSVVLRLNDDGSTPGDNPFFAQGGNLARYFAYGIRNSFGMAFDPVTDRLWTTENGPDSYDEINLVEPGFNSGWEKIMGPDSRDSDDESDLFFFPGAHYGDPKFSWLDPVGPTAILFFDSTALGASYRRDVFAGDVNNGNLYRFQPDAARSGFVFDGAGLADLVADSGAELDEVIFGTGFNGITDLKTGPDGLLYVVSLGDGTIYAISAVGSLAAGAPGRLRAEAGVAFSADLEISGGEAPYAVAIERGALPAGLALDGNAISGTPLEPGGSSLRLRISDQLGALIAKRLRILVSKPVAIATSGLKTGKAGRRYRTRLRAKGGIKPYSWSLVSGAFPDDLALDPATGRITGTAATVGSTDLTFEVADPLGGTAQTTLTLTIE